MAESTTTRFRTICEPRLSLWQSCVREALRELEPDLKATDDVVASNHQLLEHLTMRAVTEHTSRAFARPSETFEAPKLRGTSDAEFEELVYVSHLKFEIAEAEHAGDNARADTLRAECRQYATCDWKGWVTCLSTYLEYKTKYKEPLYQDWKKLGKPIDTFGVMPYRLKNDAKVAILGDWGTGLSDSKALLTQIVREHRPDVIIHLGDIYYSGTPMECELNVAKIFDEVFMEVTGGVRVPVITIPGNHDYYAFGAGYYPLLKTLNQVAWRQEASYCCLRTEDQRWQFLGMDTGRNDYWPLNDVDPFYAGPWLEPSEIEWHKNKLEGFTGSTILLSHHQLYSQHSAIGPRTVSRPWMNEHLFDAFQPHFHQISAWFWGHEHNLIIFKDGLFNLNKGRLVGCSAYEESMGESPYDPHNADYERNVPYRQPVVKLSSDDDYYRHGYAIIDLKRTTAAGPINVAYYQIRSWAGQGPVDPPPVNEVFRETIESIAEPQSDVVNFDDSFYLRHSKGQYFVAFTPSRGYKFPRLANTGPVVLELRGGVGAVKSGVIIELKSTEDGLGAENILGAWKDSHDLYYWKKDYDPKKQGWRVTKLSGAGDEIHYGDKVAIHNQYWTKQLMCKDTRYEDYLTTKERVDEYWYFCKPEAAEGAPQT